MKIIGIGNAIVDILIQLDSYEHLKKYNLPKGSMTLVDLALSDQILSEISGRKKIISSGGSAANTIYGLANLGLETAFIGKTGDDEHGRFFKDELVANNIKPILFSSSNNTGKAITLITPDFERTFATYLGASDELSEKDLTAEIFKGFDLLYIEGYLIPDKKLISKIMKLAKSAGLKIAIDLASYNLVGEYRQRLNELIEKYIDIVFANEEEARELTGLDTFRAAEVISEICDLVIIKTGAKGSIVRHNKRTLTIKPSMANPIDATGAGDLYASGFIYGLSKNASLSACGNIGSLLAAKVIESIGAKIDEASWKTLIKEINKITIFWT